jgi:dihydroorotase
MSKILIKNATLVNEGNISQKDILIENELIIKIENVISPPENCLEINAEGLLLIPGCIDDQVHFREPGLTHKGNIKSESRAAVAGGITSFMEMPNTVPNALTQELLQEKYDIASKSSYANYSFFMGASNENIEEVLKTNHKNVCGLKIFMGSSTGNMLVDNETVLDELFKKVPPMLIATHCEDEKTVKENLQKAIEQYGNQIPINQHPIIRSHEACYLSSSMAIYLAKKHHTRLHILHISTAKELDLFRNDIPLEKKLITSEACVHHLWFSDKDYAEKGNFIKWNPAVKTENDRNEIWKAVLDDRIDIIATDHAPHTLEEKQKSYLEAPSGGPLVQHALLVMLEKNKEGVISLEKIVEKMAHAPAKCFKLKNRGFIREGYFADLVLINPNKKTEVNKENILYHCKWSPFEGFTFSNSIEKTIINGTIVYENEKVAEIHVGQRLTFDR